MRSHGLLCWWHHYELCVHFDLRNWTLICSLWLAFWLRFAGNWHFFRIWLIYVLMVWFLPWQMFKLNSIGTGCLNVLVIRPKMNKIPIKKQCLFCMFCVCVCSIKVIACVVCGSVKETAIKLTDIFMHNKATNIIKRFELFWHRFYDSSVFAFYFSSVVMKCERSPSFYSPSHKNPIQTDSEWWERARERKKNSIT